MNHSSSHSLTKWWSTLPYKEVQLSLHFPCGTKLSTHLLPYMGHLRFIRNCRILTWAKPINSNNPPPDLKCPFRDLPILFACLIYQWFNRDCKVELPPRTLSYIRSHLNNGLRLELQVLRELVSLKGHN